ncbi:MAG: hypothetical protein HY459_05040 [Parcubacteria group bacterium]|nr:hypothetical protein [Parcubacteria group bacterium]
MALNSYVLATVRVLISRQGQDMLSGDDRLQALCELYHGGKLDIYSVNQGLVDVLKERDLVLVDIGLTNIPNTSQAAPKNEIVKIIRNDARSRIENIYKELESEAAKQPRLGYLGK